MKNWWRWLATLAGFGGVAFVAYKNRTTIQAKLSSMNALDMIKKFEGLVLKAYQDVGGVWTIGYGATGTDIKQGVEWTNQQAEDDLASRVARLQQQIVAAVTTTLTDNQLAALTSLAYNIGFPAFSSSTLLKDLNAGNTQKAADDFLVWNHVKGQVNDDLTKRRGQERDVFLS